MEFQGSKIAHTDNALTHFDTGVGIGPFARLQEHWEGLTPYVATYF